MAKNYISFNFCHNYTYSIKQKNTELTEENWIQEFENLHAPGISCKMEKGKGNFSHCAVDYSKIYSYFRRDLQIIKEAVTTKYHWQLKLLHQEKMSIV